VYSKQPEVVIDEKINRKHDNQDKQRHLQQQVAHSVQC
jgi:hypothetical protein